MSEDNYSPFEDAYLFPQLGLGNEEQGASPLVTRRERRQFYPSHTTSASASTVRQQTVPATTYNEGKHWLPIGEITTLVRDGIPPAGITVGITPTGTVNIKSNAAGQSHFLGSNRTSLTFPKLGFLEILSDAWEAFTCATRDEHDNEDTLLLLPSLLLPFRLIEPIHRIIGRPPPAAKQRLATSVLGASAGAGVHQATFRGLRVVPSASSASSTVTAMNDSPNTFSCFHRLSFLNCATPYGSGLDPFTPLSDGYPLMHEAAFCSSGVGVGSGSGSSSSLPFRTSTQQMNLLRFLVEVEEVLVTDLNKKHFTRPAQSSFFDSAVLLLNSHFRFKSTEIARMICKLKGSKREQFGAKRLVARHPSCEGTTTTIDVDILISERREKNRLTVGLPQVDDILTGLPIYTPCTIESLASATGSAENSASVSTIIAHSSYHDGRHDSFSTYRAFSPLSITSIPIHAAAQGGSIEAVRYLSGDEFLEDRLEKLLCEARSAINQEQSVVDAASNNNHRVDDREDNNRNSSPNDEQCEITEMTARHERGYTPRISRCAELIPILEAALEETLWWAENATPIDTQTAVRCLKLTTPFSVIEHTAARRGNSNNSCHQGGKKAASASVTTLAGWAPLHFSVQEHHAPLTRHLIRQGANASIVSCDPTLYKASAIACYHAALIGLVEHRILESIKESSSSSAVAEGANDAHVPATRGMQQSTIGIIKALVQKGLEETRKLVKRVVNILEAICILGKERDSESAIVEKVLSAKDKTRGSEGSQSDRQLGTPIGHTSKSDTLDSFETNRLASAALAQAHASADFVSFLCRLMIGELDSSRDDSSTVGGNKASGERERRGSEEQLCQLPYRVGNEFGSTPLHSAVRYLNCDAIRVLLDEGGCDPTARDASGMRPADLLGPPLWSRRCDTDSVRDDGDVEELDDADESDEGGENNSVIDEENEYVEGDEEEVEEEYEYYTESDPYGDDLPQRVGKMHMWPDGREPREVTLNLCRHHNHREASHNGNDLWNSSSLSLFPAATRSLVMGMFADVEKMGLAEQQQQGRLDHSILLLDRVINACRLVNQFFRDEFEVKGLRETALGLSMTMPELVHDINKIRELLGAEGGN